MTRPDCATCGQLVDVLTAAVAERGQLDVIAEWEAVRAHLVDAHAAELPGYVSGCWNCEEWKRVYRAGVGAPLRPVLQREAELHRAGHRLALRDLVDGGQVAELTPPAPVPPAWAAAIARVWGAHLCTSPACACMQLVYSCPVCQRTSHHPDDARNGWCSACQCFTGDPRGLGMGPA